MADLPLSRRQTLAGVAVVGAGAPLLVACGGDESSTATDPAGSGSSSTTSSGAPAGEAPAAGLASASDIPVGGGRIFPDDNVVIVQPTAGEFKGWSATCTHQGCAVAEVDDEGIHCPCHGSVFALDDGSPQGGPATQPLEEVRLAVDGDSINLA